MSELLSKPGPIRSIAHRLAGESIALPVEGHLASFDGATSWLNTEPLTPEGLRGRVVLVDFWTYTCVNWLRTFPYVRAWAAKYADAGLTVVGVHTPEFGFEREPRQRRRAVAQPRRRLPGRGRQRLRGLARLRQPLLAGGVHRGRRGPDPLPPLRRGRVRDDRDGHRSSSCSTPVRTGSTRTSSTSTHTGSRWPPTGGRCESPETYTGYGQATGFAQQGDARYDEPHAYDAPARLSLNHWALAGTWTVARHAAISTAAGRPDRVPVPRPRRQPRDGTRIERGRPSASGSSSTAGPRRVPTGRTSPRTGAGSSASSAPTS